MSLVVVLRDHQVESAIIGAGEDGIGRNRPDHVDTLGLCQFHGGREEFGVLGADRPFSQQCRLRRLAATRPFAAQPQEMLVTFDRGQHALGACPFDRPLSRYCVET